LAGGCDLNRLIAKLIRQHARCAGGDLPDNRPVEQRRTDGAFVVRGSQKRSSMNRTICQGCSADLVQLVATLSAAFQNDPALVWILPDPAQRFAAAKAV
jgi:hypothetical protein